MKIKKTIKMFSRQILIWIFCGFVFFPIYWLVTSSVNPRGELYIYPPKFFPIPFSFRSYFEVIRQFPIMQWLSNTFVVSAATSIVSIFLGCLAAYSLSRFRFKGRWTTMIILLTTQMIPGTLLVIPIYLIFMRLQLLDSLSGLTVAYSTFSLPFCIWMLKGFFDTIPKEIDEAAMIDGCSRNRTLFSILFPLIGPGIAATTLFSFIMGWDEYLLARVFLSTREKWVVSMGISSFHGQYGVFFDQVAAAGFISCIPVLILFFFLQKHFVAGLTQGGVKG